MQLQDTVNRGGKNMKERVFVFGVTERVLKKAKYPERGK